MVSLTLHLASRTFTGPWGLSPIPAPAPQLHWTPNMPVVFQYQFAPTNASAQGMPIYFSSKTLCILQSPVWTSPPPGSLLSSLVIIQHVLPCTATEDPCWLVATFCLLLCLCMYIQLLRVTACFPSPGLGPHCSPKRPEAGFHLEKGEIKQYFLFFIKKVILSGRASILRKLSLGLVSITSYKHLPPRIHTFPTGPLNSIGRWSAMVYFAVAVMLTFKLLFSPHPHQLLNALKNKNYPSRCVWAVWSWDWIGMKVSETQIMVQKRKKDLNRSSVKEKV